MADVFVSYKAEDRRRVKPLVDALEADGFSVWWDAHVSHGDEWRETIQWELDHAKCVLVVWSKRSVGPDGQFVRDEASRGQRRHAYLPIRVDKVDPPLGFGETQAILFNGWTGDRSDQRYQSLLEAVRSVVSGKPSPAHVHFAPPIVSRRLAIGGGAAVAATALTGAWFVFRPKPAAASNRIAVLPFANLSGDPSQAYFSDGIAEELRSSLSRIGMQVIGRASCEKVRNDDIKVAAAKLDVVNILTGSVRRSPSTIRIDAQLVSGEDGVEHWAQSYDRAPGDAIKIQTDIAENVAEALSITLGNAGKVALNIGGTSNSAAHDLFLKATRDIYTPRGKADSDRKIELFDAAISLDPNYADAYAYKAFLLAIYADDDRGLVNALAVINRAIAIAPTMAHGYDVRGYIYWQLKQMGPALANARHAVDLNGEDVNALGGYSNLLSAIGQYDQALKVSAKAIALDPLEPSRYRFRSDILFNARRYAEAADAARHAVELQPDYDWNRVSLAAALLAQGKDSEAGAELGKVAPASPGRVSLEALIAARKGQRTQALDKLKTLKGLPGGKDHSSYAEIYAQLGMRGDAFKELDLAFQAHNLKLLDLRSDPFLDPLRSDPRYAALERKIGAS